MTQPSGFQPYQVRVADDDLHDLRRRLANTRWPEPATINDWSQGVPLESLRVLCEHWAKDYDWRGTEARLNELPQFIVEIDGLPIHLFHVRSSQPDALPLILANGWPSSIIEFLGVLGPLTEPAAHGAPSAPAFHIVVPTLPGFGFGAKPVGPGWNVQRIAAAWDEIMHRLGYARYVVSGGDWGSTVATALAMDSPAACAAVHLTMPLVFPEPADLANPTERETSAIEALQHFEAVDSAYAKLQATKPQTLAYGLTDSPVGQAAWIYEKLQAWTDNEGSVVDLVGMDTVIDMIMMYWLSRSAGSSARLYWESLASFKPGRIGMPVGVSVFPKETFRPSRRWAERAYDQIIHWNEPERGGHFPALEQPQAFVDELRTCFGEIACSLPQAASTNP